jgi:hypothetical protein
MSNANLTSIVYDPAQAAELLGVSASGLRRLAPIYESVFGELKRVGKGDEEKRSREWPADAIARLQTARQVTGRGRPYRTIEAALEAIRDGVETDTSEIDFASRHTGNEGAIGGALQVLIGEIQALRLEVAELKQGRELSQSAAEIKNSSAPVEQSPPAPDKHHGLLVKFSIWLESLLRR